MSSFTTLFRTTRNTTFPKFSTPPRFLLSVQPYRPISVMSNPNPSLQTTSNSKISYNNKTFTSTTNSPNGEVSSSTKFHYHQSGSLVWAEYAGGSIMKGFLIANVLADNGLDMRYQHVNIGGELMTGICRSWVEVLEDGRLRLKERWRWTCGEESEGNSVVEEVRDEEGG